MVECAFLAIYLKEPRTLWLGTSFLLLIGSTTLLLTAFLISIDQSAPVYMLAIVLVLCLMLFPTVMNFTFLINGIRVIKHEGFRFCNILALSFGIALFDYLTVWPTTGDLTPYSFLNSIYFYISFLAAYFLTILNLYTIAAVLNLWYFNAPKVDYLIVLGAGLNGDKVTPLLAARIDKAIQLYRKQPRIRLMMTEGKGSDELVAEGVAMANYALE